MQRRAILLLILLVVLTVFYASGVRRSGLEIKARENMLLEQMNKLDEHANESTAKTN